jgi:hypothetical protein
VTVTIEEPQARRQREHYSGRAASSLTADEAYAAHAAGYEPGDGDRMVGRDPRTLSQDDLRAMGHQPMPATAAIRARCLDCCGGSPNEVRWCVAVACPSWPWRMASNPWRQPASEARREAGRRLAARMRASASNPGMAPDASDETDAEVE